MSLLFIILVQSDKSDCLFTPSPTKYEIKDISVRSPAWVISRSKRRPLDYESFTKNCGTYKYKSYIGEGPKYTFSQKFNLDGTLTGKRHPKAHVIEPTPGPGSYNIKSDFGGPKYTMGLKRVTKSLSQNNLSPGVGSYEMRKDSSFQKPCFKFDTEKRDNLEINKSSKNYPGPGTYKEINALESKGFKWTFPQQGRFTKIKPRNSKLVRIQVPGPGSYNIQNLIGNEGPKYTFNKVKFNHSDGVDEGMKEKTCNFPSPGSYLKKIDYIPDMPKYTIPKSEKMKSEIKSKFPRPWNYNPKFEYNSIFKKIPNIIVPKDRKYEDEVKNPNYKKLIIPGPGYYDYKNGELPQGPSFTIRNLQKKIKIKEEPGPGEYDLNDKHRNKEPSYSIGREQRDDNLKTIKKDDYPGPGSYDTKELNLSPKFSFPRENIGANKKVEIPGPGFYKIPTSFDYVSDMARSNGSFDPNYRYV